jgi:hypothetical protein
MNSSCLCWTLCCVDMSGNPNRLRLGKETMSGSAPAKRQVACPPIRTRHDGGRRSREGWSRRVCPRWWTLHSMRSLNLSSLNIKRVRLSIRWSLLNCRFYWKVKPIQIKSTDGNYRRRSNLNNIIFCSISVGTKYLGVRTKW